MKTLSIIAGLATASVLMPQAGRAAEKQPPFEIVTPGFALKFAPDRAWTFSRIDYHSEVMGQEAGFYGATLATEPGKFIGTGHDEGGVEEVESISITLDGKEVEAETLSGLVNCNGATVVKQSKIGNLKHLAEVTIQEDRIDFRYRLEVVSDGLMELAYPMMFCWSPETTEWMAGLKSGEERSGRFTSEEGWHLQEDASWTAVYNPRTGVAAVMVFAADFPQGKLHKHAFWDRTMYHKQYFQGWWREEIAAGDVLDCRATLLPVKATAESWKPAVREAVARFQAEP